MRLWRILLIRDILEESLRLLERWIPQQPNPEHLLSQILEVYKIARSIVANPPFPDYALRILPTLQPCTRWIGAVISQPFIITGYELA
jgi:hypothetical protein